MGLGTDRWANGKTGIAIGRDKWGRGKTGGVRAGLPSCVPAVVRMLVLPLALNEASV